MRVQLTHKARVEKNSTTRKEGGRGGTQHREEERRKAACCFLASSVWVVCCFLRVTLWVVMPFLLLFSGGDGYPSSFTCWWWHCLPPPPVGGAAVLNDSYATREEGGKQYHRQGKGRKAAPLDGGKQQSSSVWVVLPSSSASVQWMDGPPFFFFCFRDSLNVLRQQDDSTLFYKTPERSQPQRLNNQTTSAQLIEGLLLPRSRRSTRRLHLRLKDVLCTTPACIHRPQRKKASGKLKKLTAPLGKMQACVRTSLPWPACAVNRGSRHQLLRPVLHRPLHRATTDGPTWSSASSFLPG